LLSCYWSICYH